MIAKRIYFENAVYHVMSRGNNRQFILKAQDDKLNFLESLSKYKIRYDFKLYAFVLMDNHFHLLLEANSRHNVSKIMQAILLSYSRKYRIIHDYVGHLWQGRFNSKPIVGDVYIRECLEYVHNNPVRAKIVDDPQDYIWSSARFYHGSPNKMLEDAVEIDRYENVSAITHLN